MKRVIALILSSAILSGCASLIGAAREEPVQEDVGSRTTGSYIDDELIEVKAIINISKGSQELQQSNVSVTSFNGIVLLSGQVASERSKLEAEQIVGQIRKIRRVHNELTLTSPTSALTRASDTLITTKIKANMLGDEAVDATRIKVVTENGVVYLMGLVTRNEADKAVDLVRRVNGIQKIIKIFEYVDDTPA